VATFQFVCEVVDTCTAEHLGRAINFLRVYPINFCWSPYSTQWCHCLVWRAVGEMERLLLRRRMRCQHTLQTTCPTHSTVSLHRLLCCGRHY
jgi:hypothetical protein